MTEKAGHLTGLEIAIIGMACLFPGARDVEEFWKNLQEGKETITFFSDKVLQAIGVHADKTNIGHLDTAAGVAGLIKTVLAMRHQTLFPSLHFDIPNPEINFANSPFYVQTTLAQWKRGATPRRAGVSSFGISGTNAHVILEEAPPLEASSLARSHHLLLLSARTDSALEAMTARDEIQRLL